MPGSSCVATPTIGSHTTPPQPKPITGPMAPPGAGGYDFLADPNRRADDSPVFWRPGELAAVIILTAAPAGTEMPSISLTDLPGDIIRRDAEDGAHVMIRDDAISHQLWLIDPPNGATPLRSSRSTPPLRSARTPHCAFGDTSRMGGIEHRQVRFIASTAWSLPCARSTAAWPAPAIGPSPKLCSTPAVSLPNPGRPHPSATLSSAWRAPAQP